MSHGYGNSDRDKLLRLIQSKGFGVRASERALKAVLDTMKRGLCRGEMVEIPGGRIVKAKNNRTRTELHRFRNRHCKKFSVVVEYGVQPIRIKFIPDRQLRLDSEE